jgi:hypothetical protein
LTLLSAAVLGGALVVALTSASFELDGGARAQPAATASAALAIATTRATAPTPAPYVQPPAHKVVYYIVNSQEQAISLRGARRADALYVSEYGLPPFPAVSAYYVMYRSSAEEREGERLLHDLANLAPAHGIEFHIVDLRE